MIVGVAALATILLADKRNEENREWLIFSWGFAKQILPLLAAPSLSLPNMLVIQGVMGTRKTIVYVALVIAMATLSGFIFGNLF